MRHPFCRYSYSIDPGRRFDRYGLEQQTALARHRFMADRVATLAQVPERSLLRFA